MSEQKQKQSDIDFDSLKFVRIFTPMHIPKYLIEQIKDRNYEVDKWYEYQETICMRQTPEGPIINPLSMLYVIADSDNKVVGMLWCDVEILSKSLVVQIFSMDKDYWYKGKAVKLGADKAKEIARECGFKKIIWLTSYPKHYERYGFKKSRITCMEWDLTEEKEDVGNFQRKRETDGVSTADGPADERSAHADASGAGGAG